MFTTNIINYFFFFDKAGCTRCFFSKTHQSSLNLKFFLKSTRPSFFDKAGCTRQFESELSLRSFAPLFPIKEGPFENPPVLPYP